MRLERSAPVAWALALALLMLGPALGAGYVLSYDMVWVPDLALRPDLLGLGSALPRAVPSDAVVAVLDELVPGMLLQKLVMVGALVLGGAGAARLAGDRLVARMVAVSAYVWSPFVVERLWLGHWPVLLGWAVLPWLLREGDRWRRDGRARWLPLLLPLGCLSANAGVMSALALLAVGLGSGRAARDLRLVGLVVAGNAPWAVAGALHAGAATSSAAGSVFALGGEGPVPAPLAALTLGGTWNADVVPASRQGGLLSLVLTVVLLLAAVAGGRLAWHRLGPRLAGTVVALWAVGYAAALFTWALPDAVGALSQAVPGAGLLRDGARSLALCAPLVALVAASGAERLAGWWGGRSPGRVGTVQVAVAGALLPLALMPDAAWGISGALRPASYPTGWAAARDALDRPPPGDLLVLPFTSYRAPAWNHGHSVLDPLPRYLQPDYVASDQLVVDGRVIPGEDPRVPAVLAALREPDPESRSAALGRLGIGLVARETDVPASREYDAPVPGTVLYRGPGLELLRIDTPVDLATTPTGWLVAVSLAWAAYLLLPAAGLVGAVRSRFRRNPARRTRRVVGSAR